MDGSKLLYKVEICFNDDGSKKDGFVYEFGNLGNGWEIIIKEEKSGCWDIIVYDRFFDDDDPQEELVKDDEVLVR